ncbi:hypothetical protein AVEN_168288-1 [Araneus ventricosus]|uniref:Uncharacterized protein n=1 Tax=Araneus ventricosus TaxID=182803 RepID=A0A4Y2FXU1_ARAVE|nr:hypothetical protein AVEN_168288-1 [Araneus ventricosus]
MNCKQGRPLADWTQLGPTLECKQGRPLADWTQLGPTPDCNLDSVRLRNMEEDKARVLCAVTRGYKTEAKNLRSYVTA